MTIKEVEEKTGLTRSNIRFYENENLIKPLRNERNGYREYSDENVEDIKKIAYLRTLGITIDNIRNIIFQKVSLVEVVEKQEKVLETKISDLENAKTMCNKMLESDELSYLNLKVEQYITELPEYWNKNKPVFKLDSVSFLYIWGGKITWGIITIACLLIAITVFPKLPPQIPIQWNNGVANYVDKKFIYAYSVICIVFRILLRPFIWRWLQIHAFYSDTIADYLTNFMCFVALSIEIFSILFIYNIVRHVTVIIFIDILVFIALLIIGVYKLFKKYN
ncbi:transcriptional regulator [Clostridioides difficile]|uniref:MerR family transcriptional regulator n=1 Tax=Clostridioides difficile TaxID=1496 RepID=UPI00093CEAFA|nr:MerR family transcriptional regulator [Clostridioides difficile]AXU76685.1 transcriptional regulator [Clostridioides difficile]EGT2198107.1 MerR family transcriptional regulator [Clostridioides difficile]MDL0418299.1 MerR family transcriptional regulator [Clostridioides difficile]HBH3665831.1 MerR family transcriptional regulator [Clostridioides difficile]